VRGAVHPAAVFEARLIRASILDIAARRRAAHARVRRTPRARVIAANAPIERTLQAVVRLVEQMHPAVGAAIELLDDRGAELRLAAATGLPKGVTDLLVKLAVGMRHGSCGAAASLGRQVVIRDVAVDSLLRRVRPRPARGRHPRVLLHADRDGRRPRSRHARDLLRLARGRTLKEIDLITRLTQLAGIAIRRQGGRNRAAR